LLTVRLAAAELAAAIAAVWVDIADTSLSV
jgi:hypothetical protein